MPNVDRYDWHGAERFATTRWTVVLGAARDDSRDAIPALEELCRSYWYPLYAFARRTGCSADDARDLTQGYFAKLLEKQYLKDVRRDRGRFRSFLLASFKHFMANERKRARAQKRGGGRVLVPIDAGDAEARYAVEPVDEATAEHVFERRWALTLLEQALERLRDDDAQAGKQELFEALRSRLTGGAAEAAPYAEIARRLEMTPGAVKVAAHRLRRRYRELLRNAIADTVASPARIDDELRHFRAILAR